MIDVSVRTLAEPGHVRFGLLSAQWSFAETAFPTLATWSRTLNIVSWKWSQRPYAHSLVVRLDKRSGCHGALARIHLGELFAVTQPGAHECLKRTIPWHPCVGNP